MKWFGWFRKKHVKEAPPPPVTPRKRSAQVGTLEHAQNRLAGQLRARDKWQAIVDEGQGHGNKTHEECVVSLFACSEMAYSGYPNKIAYWEAMVEQAQNQEK